MSQSIFITSCADQPKYVQEEDGRNSKLENDLY